MIFLGFFFAGGRAALTVRPANAPSSQRQMAFAAIPVRTAQIASSVFMTHVLYHCRETRSNQKGNYVSQRLGENFGKRITGTANR